MKRIPLIAFLFISFFGTTLRAQSSVTPQVLASSGRHLENVEVHLDFTLGEFMVQTIGNDPKVTQGFHQPGLEMINQVVEPSFEGKVSVYPNPFQTELDIKINDQREFCINISDLKGTVMMRQKFSAETRLNLTTLEPGMYTILITLKDARIYSGVIEKIK
jgi:hypothetical protein